MRCHLFCCSLFWPTVYTYVLQGTNEMLRLFISLTCLQHAGLEIREMVKSVSLSLVGMLAQLANQLFAFVCVSYIGSLTYSVSLGTHGHLLFCYFLRFSLAVRYAPVLHLWSSVFSCPYNNNNNNNNNSSFILTADNPQLIYNTLPHRTAQIQLNTKNQPNITTRISMGGRQLQVSTKVDHNAVN